MNIQIWSDDNNGTGSWDYLAEFWLGLDADNNHVTLKTNEQDDLTFNLDELSEVVTCLKAFRDLDK